MSASVECKVRVMYVCMPTVPKRANLRTSQCIVELVRDANAHLCIQGSRAKPPHAVKFMFNIDENDVEVVPVTADAKSTDTTARGSIAVRLGSGTVVNIILEAEEEEPLKRFLAAVQSLSSEDPSARRNLLESVRMVSTSAAP